MDFQDIPQYLVSEWNFPSLWMAGFFCTLIFMFVVMTPFVMRGLGGISLMMGGTAMLVSVGLGWLDSWIVLIEVMAVVGLFSFGLMKKVT